MSPTKDSYVKQGTPNQAQGGDPILRLQASGKNRAVIEFSTSSIQALLTNSTLVSATLVLAIDSAYNNWGTEGRPIALHRVTVPWSEPNATWNCANDANPSNNVADCAGTTTWNMDGSGPRPWDAAATATAVIQRLQKGTVSFDVTSDVAAFADGSIANNGWLLKKVDEGDAGQVDFKSRETGSAGPVLIVVTQPKEVLLYADDFAGTLANWVEKDPDNNGRWSIDNQELVGDYGIGCGSPGCHQTDLLLVDALQPGDINWRVEATSLAQLAYCCYNGGATVNLAKFSLWVSDSEKEAIEVGYVTLGVTLPTSVDSVSFSHQAYQWHGIGGGWTTVPVWNPNLPQTATLERHGNTYTAFFNGIQVYQTTRTFSAPPKVGFHTYAAVRVDDFKLYSIP